VDRSEVVNWLAVRTAAGFGHGLRSADKGRYGDCASNHCQCQRRENDKSLHVRLLTTCRSPAPLSHSLAVRTAAGVGNRLRSADNARYGDCAGNHCQRERCENDKFRHEALPLNLSFTQRHSLPIGRYWH
jgi:hypothetical protein